MTRTLVLVIATASRLYIILNLIYGGVQHEYDLLSYYIMASILTVVNCRPGEIQKADKNRPNV